LLLCPEHRQIARETARRSLVLLKNENNLLPIKPGIKSIAVIGPLADNSKDILGCWRGMGDSADAVSLLKGIRNRDLGKTKIYYSKGCNIEGDDRTGFSKAVNTAKKADLVILAMGESANMSGEARSRSFLGLPGVQMDLIKEIKKTGKPVVLVLMNGRPLAIPWESENLNSILETWFAGTEAGNAIADVLFGDYNPSGKLVASFPYTTGQVPVYYNHKRTGRPASPNEGYSSKYFDSPIESLFPFGFGLSYTKFDYSGLTLSKKEMNQNDTSIVSVTVKNSGQYDGEEVVQLYIRDLKGSVTRPISELKGFEKILLKVGEEKQVKFILSKALLSFFDIDMNYLAEPGEFKIMVGTSSAKYLETKFTLKD
jgi:beta-glucosidase